MKKMLTMLFILPVLFVSFSMAEVAVVAQPQLYQATVIQTAAKAINYRNLKGSVEIDFKGTVLLPDAKGSAVVRNNAGMISIKAEFEKLTTPVQFGAEYLTYVLWAMSPDGRAVNLGELIVDDGESRLRAETPFQALSLIVTAEPHFAVSQPGNVVILGNEIRPGSKAKIEIISAEYELLPKGQYIKNTSEKDLESLVPDKKTPLVVYQARNAVRLAKAAGAETYAAEHFKNAERLLALVETYAENPKEQILTALEAIQSAEGSRSIAEKRQGEESVMIERNQAKDQIRSANNQTFNAIGGQIKAEDAQIKAELEKEQSNTDRTSALNLATSAEASAADAKADAKSARKAAGKSKGQAEAANDRAEKAEDEKADLRMQLEKQ